MKKYCLTLYLKEDDNLLPEYEYWHKSENGWPGIRKSITDSGIREMEIYRLQTRLFMTIETADSFDFAVKAKMDAVNPKVQEWEQMTSRPQPPLAGAKQGEQWILMEKIFQLI